MSKDGYVRHDKTEYEVMLTSDVLENELSFEVSQNQLCSSPFVAQWISSAYSGKLF